MMAQWVSYAFKAMSLLDVCERENIVMIFPECHLLLCFSGFSDLARQRASTCPFQAGWSVPTGMGSLGLHHMSHFSYSFCKSLGLVSTPWPVSTGLFTPRKGQSKQCWLLGLLVELWSWRTRRRHGRLRSWCRVQHCVFSIEAASALFQLCYPGCPNLPVPKFVSSQLCRPCCRSGSPSSSCCCRIAMVLWGAWLVYTRSVGPAHFRPVSASLSP